MTEIEVEAAAAAIQQSVCNRSGRGRDWNQLPKKVKDEFRQEARAALGAAAAMRGSR